MPNELITVFTLVDHYYHHGSSKYVQPTAYMSEKQRLLKSVQADEPQKTKSRSEQRPIWVIQQEVLLCRMFGYGPHCNSVEFQLSKEWKFYRHPDYTVHQSSLLN